MHDALEQLTPLQDTIVGQRTRLKSLELTVEERTNRLEGWSGPLRKKVIGLRRWKRRWKLQGGAESGTG